MTTGSSSDLTALLRQARNPDGGWGYYPRKAARLEPTAWAALALAGTQGASEAAATLERWPFRDNLLLERSGGEFNYGFHGLALLVMHACGIQHSTGSATLLAGMQRVKGVRLDQPPVGRQDNSLQGWSWIPQTFSWVEPTAWCMFALKKWARSPNAQIDRARIDEAERLLINRSCVEGGWNYGNSDVLGRDLLAYVPTSAIALIALQDRRDHPIVARSIDYLERYATSERSGTALALAFITLGIYGRSTDAVRSALIEQLPTTIALGNCAAIAMAAYALNHDKGHAAFTL
jgi:hypothetical protein